jgi:hypothetical protein
VPSSQVPESVLIWVLAQSFANTVDLVDLFARLVQGAGISAVSHTVIFDFVLWVWGSGLLPSDFLPLLIYTLFLSRKRSLSGL